jgi:O-antigen/teichoic acid export membrane protein
MSFLKTSSIALFVRIIGALSALFFNFIIAKSLNLSDAGTFFLGYTVLTILWTLSSMGMPLAVVRFVGSFYSKSNWQEINIVFSTAIKRVLLVSILLSTILFITSNYFLIALGLTSKFRAVFDLLVFLIPVVAIYNLIGSFFQGIHKPVISIFIQNIIAPILTCFVLLFSIGISKNITTEFVAYVFAFCSTLTLIISICFGAYHRSLNFKIKTGNCVALVEASKYFFQMTLMGLVVQWSGVLVTGILLTEEKVALFSVAQRISVLVSFILIAINVVVAPRFSASFANNNINELRLTAISCSRLMIVFAMPILFIIFTFPEVILGFFGEEYIQAALILKILAIGQFINVVTGSVGYLLNMTGHEKDMRNVVFLSGPVGLILALILTPMYGTLGAAIATSIAVASQNLLAVFFVKKRLGFNSLNIF